MTIEEAVKAGIARLGRAEWAWTNFIELRLFGDGTHGPWVKLTSLTYGEPTVSDLFVGLLPWDDQWEKWEVPAEHLEFLKANCPNYERSLWEG